VSDPASPIAAANGQYILIRREAYDAVGGHAAIASDILEDVALARAVKTSRRKIRFRYAADAVRTRMYRNYRQLRDGWDQESGAAVPEIPLARYANPFFGWGIPVHKSALALIRPAVVHRAWWFVPGALVFARNAGRMRRANFDVAMEFLAALFGMPMFAYLLLRSKRAHADGSVSWKGRNLTARKMAA